MIISKSKNVFCFLLLTFLIAPAFGKTSPLEEYFKYKAEGKTESAMKVLNNWDAKGNEEKTYKKYFIALHQNSINLYWDLYQDLSKQKVLLKLQHESIKKIIELDLLSKTDETKSLKNFDKIAKKMLTVLSGLPEGVDYELLYLKRAIKKNQFKQLCTTERSRWLSLELPLSEITSGLKTCAMTYNDFLYRIRMLIYSGEEAKARSEITEYTNTNKLAQWEKVYLEAVFFSNAGDPVSAFDKIVAFEKDLRTNEDYYLNLFYIAQRAGQQKKAEEIINNIIKATTAKGRLNDLKFQKAFLFYQTKRYGEAIEIFDKLIVQHASHKRKVKSIGYDEITWLRAWCHYLNRNYEKAALHLKENMKWSRDQAKNIYWLAQAEWALGNQIAALEKYRQLAAPVLAGKYFSYYNHLGWLRFESYKNAAMSGLMKNQLSTIRFGKGLYLLPDLTTRPEDLINEYQSYIDNPPSSEETQSESEVNKSNPVLDSKETEGIKVDSSQALRAEMAWSDILNRGGYRDLARWHLYEVEKNLKTKSDVLPLAQYYLDNEFYNRAIQLMQRVGNVSTKKLSLQDEEILWKSLFPRAFEAKTQAEAKRQNISKYLVWSIMKAETQFKADAISPVGAVGLMQFMPYTSKKVAVILKDDFKPSKLFEPEFAIQYGASYLKKLSDELGEQVYLIAAGYNGGPHRVKLWLKNFGQSNNASNYNLDNDEFIEHIPFSETRTYVKRVMNFYLTYQKLYDDKFDLKTSKWMIGKNEFKLKEPISLKEEWPTSSGGN